MFPNPFSTPDDNLQRTRSELTSVSLGVTSFLSGSAWKTWPFSLPGSLNWATSSLAFHSRYDGLLVSSLNFSVRAFRFVRSSSAGKSVSAPSTVISGTEGTSIFNTPLTKGYPKNKSCKKITFLHLRPWSLLQVIMLTGSHHLSLFFVSKVLFKEFWMDALLFQRQTIFGAVERKGREESIETTADCTISRHVQMTRSKTRVASDKKASPQSRNDSDSASNGARLCLRKNRHKFISVDFALNFNVM